MTTAEISYGLQYNLAPDFGQEAVNVDKTLRVINPTSPTSSEAATMAQDYMKIRYEFVKAMDWLPGAADDIDVYDSGPHTQYILRANPDQPTQVWGGMRLTKVASVGESLTWNMMSKNPAMQESAEHNEIATAHLSRAMAKGSIWDLTRLVLPMDGRVPVAEIRDVILDMFGAGMASTQAEDENTAWIFLTTTSMKNYLDRVGIKTHIVATDYVTPGDKEMSHLCVAYPAEALEHIRNSAQRSEQHAFARASIAKNSF